MSERTAQVKITVCDGCGKTITSEPDANTPVEGYHGSVTWQHDDEGYEATWFACSAPHIRKAVENALNET